MRAINTPSPTLSEKKASGDEVQLQKTPPAETPSATVNVLTPSDSGGSSGSGSGSTLGGTGDCIHEGDFLFHVVASIAAYKHTQ